MVVMNILVNSPNDQNEPDLSLHCANSRVGRDEGSAELGPSRHKTFGGNPLDLLNANGDCGLWLRITGRSVPRLCRRRVIQPGWTVAATEESPLTNH